MMTYSQKLTTFRQAIERKEILVAPGAYDALTAKIIESLGFEAIFFSGGSVSISLLGVPDIGLISYSEMLNHARNMVHAVDIPVFADGDNGYGNAINVQRTVREYEAAGIVGIQLDDLVLPKRYAEPAKQLLPMSEVKAKIQAAVDAKTYEDFTIIFRTLSRLERSLEEAIDRANIAIEVGADVIFIDGVQSEDELQKLTRSIQRPLLVNMNEKRSVSSHFSAVDMEALGFSIALFPVSSIAAAAQGIFKVLTALKEHGATTSAIDEMMPVTELYNFVGLNEYTEREKSYLPLNKDS